MVTSLHLLHLLRDFDLRFSKKYELCEHLHFLSISGIPHCFGAQLETFVHLSYHTKQLSALHHGLQSVRFD